MPRRVVKSSAKDSAQRPLGRELRGGRSRHIGRTDLAHGTALGGASSPNVGRSERRAQASHASLDSDLEAFSHNPAHGSFAPLAFQPSAMTNCVNQRFLSY
uniref:Uncharacterized protein n=1 Tax=Hordeum vulgare subsp. vulgare TaxID=112509 RepID=A0A8I6XC10_HORVV